MRAICGPASPCGGLDEEARHYGLPGVHFQVIHQGANTQNLSGIDGEKASEDLIMRLPFSSLTNYQYAHILNVDCSYPETTPKAVAEWARVSDKFTELTCFPMYPSAGTTTQDT